MSQESLPVSMLTSIRYYWNDTLPTTHGWPFYRTTITVNGISVEPATRIPLLLRRVHIAAGWAEVSRVERTQNGIRLVFKDKRKPVVVASLVKSERLVQAIRSCPVPFDPTMRPSTWTDV